ncbi:transcriptional regulator [Candidatus Kaistella beijingensis]|uniref:transcriptional regulator n=1 Tax=Candidatus Kaistella beijingensis TaxID=2820270 RepID=UPI001CC5D9BC|nr:transcriptional regulator [Candidatus Kaistella beijingensis]UBB90718.1 transcriptional regulator [Candidatus Kaistella beijingensis]
MNYIRHLTGFYDRIQEDDRLNPTHISLYLALFQFWNLNHFQNPISISRNEMMRLSKISALGTYHKCIKQLQDFGYIEYLPSFNPYKGSLVNLYNFENSDVQRVNGKRIKKQTATEQAVNSHRIKIDTGIEQALIPSKNNTNILNNKHSVNTQKNIDELNYEFSEPEKEKLREKKKDFVIARRNDEAIYSNVTQSVTLSGVEALQKPGSKIPPEFPEVQMYFEEKDSTKLEAEKFYNHYESNGWLVGGKSKMKNWQAGARNWLLNSKKFNTVITSGAKQSHLNATHNKSYQEKL